MCTAASLAALYQRERTGTGQAIEVSMFDALADWAGFPLYYTMYGGTQPPRAGLSHPAIAPYGPCRAGDGASVIVAVQNDGEWVRLCEQVLDRPAAATDERFATNELRAAHVEPLRELIEAAFAGWTGEQVVARLGATRIASAILRDINGLIDHPQLVSRDRWRTVDSPEIGGAHAAAAGLPGRRRSGRPAGPNPRRSARTPPPCWPNWASNSTDGAPSAGRTA